MLLAASIVATQCQSMVFFTRAQDRCTHAARFLRWKTEIGRSRLLWRAQTSRCGLEDACKAMASVEQGKHCVKISVVACEDHFR